MATLLICGWLIMAVLMALLWIRQRYTQDASAVDVMWAAGLGVLAVFYAIASEGSPGRRWMVATMATAWSLRLAIYLYLHRVRGKAEDGRYRALRAKWGNSAQRNFFLFFQAQGLLDVVLSLSFLVAMRSSRAFPDALDTCAGAIWLVSVGGEALADRQLSRFRANPAHRGKTCREGLWRTSRHPNYFFEWVHWFSYVAAAALAPATLASPVIMLLLIVKVTGIPPTEEQALRSRGDDYRDYQKTTSALIPWVRKRGKR